MTEQNTTPRQTKGYNIIGTVSDIQTGPMTEKEGDWLSAKLTSTKDKTFRIKAYGDKAAQFQAVIAATGNEVKVFGRFQNDSFTPDGATEAVKTRFLVVNFTEDAAVARERMAEANAKRLAAKAEAAEAVAA